MGKIETSLKLKHDKMNIVKSSCKKISKIKRELDPIAFFTNKFIDFKTISLKQSHNILEEYTRNKDCEKDESGPFYYESDILKFIKYINRNLRTQIKKYTVDGFRKKSNDKWILQSYSGGRDSTYLLLKNLENGYNVDVQYNVFNPADEKYRILNEFIYLWNILAIAKQYPKRIHLNIVNVNDTCCYNMVLSQQPFNVYSLVEGMNYDSEIKECQMALISGDCGLSYIDELKSLYRSAAKFTHYYHKYNKIPPLKFPLIKTLKYDIIDGLGTNNLSDSLIFNTCASPIISNFKIEKNYIEFTISECGHCDTCEHLKLSLTKIALQYNITTVRFNYKKIEKLKKLPNPTDKLEVTESPCDDEDEEIEY